jgi:hypothetical protein
MAEEHGSGIESPSNSAVATPRRFLRSAGLAFAETSKNAVCYSRKGALPACFARIERDHGTPLKFSKFY